MAGYVVDSNTIAFYKFSDKTDPTRNSIIGNQNSLSLNNDLWKYGDEHYSHNTLSYTAGSVISSDKYFSKKSSLTIRYNEEEKIHSANLFKMDDLKFDTYIGKSYNNNYVIQSMTKNEWTLDFWLYPNFIRNGEDSIKFSSFLYIYTKSGYSEHVKFMNGYASSLHTLGVEKFVFDIRQMRIFYSENDNLPYNHYISTAIKTNYYLYVDMLIAVDYGASSMGGTTMNRGILIPLNIHTNSWNHISIIRSIEKGPLISINGLITPIIKDYNKSISENVICYSTGTIIHIGSLTGYINKTNLLTTRDINKEYNINLTKSGYTETYFYPNDPYDTIQLIPANEVQKFTCDSYIDNLRFSQAALWTSNFTPPGLIGRQFFIYDGYAYYNNENNEIVKLSFAKWEDISETDKLILLEKVSYNNFPSAEQIKLIQTDPSKDIICLNYQTDTVRPKLTIEKIDQSRSEIVYPTKFLDYGAIQDYIKNIKATGSTNATSNIRLAITRDGETYYTYNATNVAWVPLDNRSDVRTSGILLDSLDDIPASSWKQFGLDKFAFSISLSKMNEDDPCQINDITLSISLDEKWVKANKSTQVKYKYIGPTLLKINLLEEGKYKINYNDRG